MDKAGQISYMVSIDCTSLPETASSGWPTGDGTGQQEINACGAMSHGKNSLVLVEAGAHGFGHRITRGRSQGSQDTHRYLLPHQHTAHVAHVSDPRLAAFDLNEDLLRLARL